MERRGYYKLKETALGRTLLRYRFRSGCGPVVSQNTGYMNYYIYSKQINSLLLNIWKVSPRDQLRTLTVYGISAYYYKK